MSPIFLLKVDYNCVWDVYEMKEKRVDTCDGPNMTTVYINQDLEDCPCPWKSTCDRVRVKGPGYAAAPSPREIYG